MASSSSSDRVLILGGSCAAGRALKRRLGARAVATHRGSGPSDWPLFDALTDDVGGLLDRHGPFRHAVVLFAESNPDRCARDPVAARRLNVERTRAALDRLLAAGVTPVFASTESVFDGAKGDYVESDAPNPLMTYGRLKLEIERYLAEKPALVVRLARIVGTTPGDRTLFMFWLPDIAAGKIIRVAADNRFAPIHVDDVADGLARLMERGLTGLFHLGNVEGMNRREMLERLIEAWESGTGGRFSGRIEPARFADFPTLEPRPLDSTIVSAKLIAATGTPIRPIAQICREAVAAMKDA
jgi:dTDP-4-dehydrorhamnose reductase